MAIDLTCVFDSNIELILIIYKDIANVHFSNRKLGLRTFTLACHIKRKSLFRTSYVTKGCARVVIRTLRLECHTASNLSIGPDLSLKRFNAKNLILEEHEIFFYSFPYRLVLSCQSSYSSKQGVTSVIYSYFY